MFSFGNDTFGSSPKKNDNKNKFWSEINSAELSLWAVWILKAFFYIVELSLHILGYY